MFKLLLRIVLPLVAFGVALSASADGMTDLPIKNVNGRDYYYYEVQRKDTPFSLCKQFGITLDQLYQYNPTQKPMLKAFATLYFPVDTFGPNATPSAVTQAQEATEPVVAEAETEEEIIETAPDHNSQAHIPTTVGEVDVENVGNVLAEMFAQQSEPVVNVDEDNEILGVIPQVSDNDIEGDSLLDAKISPFVITLMLPFETYASNPSKMALLQTEFYKGFLLGLNDRPDDLPPIELNVIDTSLRTSNFASSLDDDEIIETNVFIGPQNEQQMAVLASRIDPAQATILNAFVINDNLTDSFPTIIKTNIPRDLMYQGAIDGFMQIYLEAIPVFLARVDGEADKVSFADLLKQRLDKEGRKYKDVVYRGVLTLEDMTSLSADGDYVFIPVSASRSEFGKFSSGLREFRVNALAEGGTVQLFGFPEWTTFRGDQHDQLKELNATIYSRFNNAATSDMQRVERAYRQWYGEEWSDVEPNQVLFGYDVANYIFVNILQNGGSFSREDNVSYTGIQSAFNLKSAGEGKGYVNNALYFITYGLNSPEVIDVLHVNINPEEE